VIQQGMNDTTKMRADITGWGKTSPTLSMTHSAILSEARGAALNVVRGKRFRPGDYHRYRQ